MAKKASSAKKSAAKKPAAKKSAAKASAQFAAPVLSSTLSAMAPMLIGGRVSINLPASQARVLWKAPATSGSICSQGTVNAPTGCDVAAITAMIYPGSTPLSKIPTDPTTVPGTTAGLIYADTYWRFTSGDSNLIPNADAGTTPPYPTNLLVIWATWTTSPATYSRAILAFDGIQFDRTDCERYP
jgi:hypothetical protein